jgi:hypothetical protein
MMRTPFVVRASTSPFSCHIAAFFYKDQFRVMYTYMPKQMLVQLGL